jgi:two-component system, chemotaxis family, protein-glutamate methylesterase/glutaminase
VQKDRLLTRRGPIENSVRPAIDPLFRSVGVSAGAGAVGVLLTGTLSDGVAGLNAIKRCGGMTIVQDPETAEYPDLPRNALASAEVDQVVPLDSLAALLDRLAREPVGASRMPPGDVVLETRIAWQEPSSIETLEQIGERSLLTCPECEGLLWEIKDGDMVRFRCHTGHAYGLESLAEAQIGGMDRALGSAMRAIIEHIQVLTRLAERAERSNLTLAAKRWRDRIEEYKKDAEQLRQILMVRQFDVDQSK